MIGVNGAAVGDGILTALGATRGDPESLEALVAGQRGRRLLTLRALLDAVRAAPAGVLPAGAAERLTRDWRLLERAERADPGAARAVVHYPLTGAWAERCLRALGRGEPPPVAGLGHLGSIAAAAAARAGLRFAADLPLHEGAVLLPTLGNYRPPAGHTRARVAGDGRALWLWTAAGPEPAPYGGSRREDPWREDPLPDGSRHDGPWQDGSQHDGSRQARSRRVSRGPGPGGAARPVVIRPGPDGVWRSAAPGWLPLRALRSASGRTVLLDDADPYRDEEHPTNPYGLTAVAALDGAEHARWRTAWQDAQVWLGLGDGSRAREVDALLDCFVPLAGSATARCSATRGEAFGALLSSTPRGGLDLAATLVHELQHAKLLALSALTVLHTADGTPGYWAPWRPDPRPFDGLFQGAYAHLALADFHLDVALSDASPAHRDAAWADHCRCRQQVGAALPQLLGSSRLTPHGFTLVKAMAAHHTRLREHAPPNGHLARATAYVETSRVIWRRGRR
ncbi:aKG-HExxH-type peptide beta-hydroxylase [Streptomyces sp. NBC_01190]|uniref:aKG-HExxH-type peptide beta-hydroxylase n=1 Tax=Streptomyces sp. NBC_01190 TaxID=2903767 RepID=UPI0038649DB2|nr:HEXXH motif-containing putative peptide modification protein [Streptomyces sp. NBC_01190]